MGKYASLQLRTSRTADAAQLGYTVLPSYSRELSLIFVAVVVVGRLFRQLYDRHTSSHHSGPS